MKYEDEYDEIYGCSGKGYSGNLGETYEEVYDQDGYSVYCPNCSTKIKWNNTYVCPDCLWTMDLEAFANYIGVDISEYKYKFK